MTRTTILFLAANPTATGPLALDRESRSIRAELERSGYGDCFAFETRWAVQPIDLLRELRRLKPTVVHFSGHGGRRAGALRLGARSRRDVVGSRRTDAKEPDGLFFETIDGGAQWVSTAALKETFSAAGASVRLVVLNACYSESQAMALAAHVDCVVGVDGSIGDAAARSFAVGFYGGLGERESVDAAHRQGRAAISLAGLRDTDRPQLIVRKGVDARQLVLATGRRGVTVDDARDEEVLAHTEPIIEGELRYEKMHGRAQPAIDDASRDGNVDVGAASRVELIGESSDYDEIHLHTEQQLIDELSCEEMCARTESMFIADLLYEDVDCYAEPVSDASAPDELQCADAPTATRYDLVAAQGAVIVAQSALLSLAISRLDDLAARIVALPADADAIARLAADIANSNETIRAENDGVVAELDKVAPLAR